MAITVKKKTLKLKNDKPEAAADPAAANASQPVLATIGQRSANAPVQSGGDFLPFVIMGVISCVLLGALLAMQISENAYYAGVLP